jgi:hypothetical protein
LLGALLGQLADFFFVGELRSAAQAFEQRDNCGCGEPLLICPVWRRMLGSAFGDVDGVAGLRLDDRSSRSLGILTQRHSPPRPEAAAFKAVFRAAVETTGSRVVVDSSKWPGYAYFLGQLPGVELSVVHLIRDPRGVSHSRRKPNAWGAPKRLNPARSALQWDAWNPLVEWLGHGRSYLRLRYEDFVAAPEDALGRVAGLVGEEPGELPFTAPGLAQLAPTHSVAGNRSRFRTGSVPIELDDDWRTAARSNRTVAALTWPARRRYGY